MRQSVAEETRGAFSEANRARTLAEPRRVFDSRAEISECVSSDTFPRDASRVARSNDRVEVLVVVVVVTSGAAKGCCCCCFSTAISGYTLREQKEIPKWLKG